MPMPVCDRVVNQNLLKTHLNIRAEFDADKSLKMFYLHRQDRHISANRRDRSTRMLRPTTALYWQYLAFNALPIKICKI